MNIEHHEHKRCDVFRVTGRIDSSNAPQLEKTLLDAIKDGHGNIIVNLGGTDYLSSAALRALISALKETRGRRIRPGNLILAEVNPQVREVFDLAALNSLFTFYDDESAAVGSF